MGLESKHKEQLSAEEKAVRVIRQYENGLFQGTRKKWGKEVMENGQQQGWLLCGPLSISSSRALNWELGIPLLPYGNPSKQEHLQISDLQIRDAPNEPPTDHTFLSYYDGKGGVLHIDPVFDLLWGDKQGKTHQDNLTGASHIKQFSVTEYPDALREDYHYVPYVVGSPLYNEMREYYKYTGYHYSQEFYKKLREAQHDDRITHETNFSYLEETVPLTRLGPELADIIREVIPGWNGIKTQR